MKTLSFITSLLFLLIPAVVAQEVTHGGDVQRTDRIKSSEITMIAEQESVQADDGGYLANPSVADCFSEMSYQYTGGRYDDETIKFRFRSPETIKPGKKYPLVVWLHGQGESGRDNERQLAHMQSMMEFLAGPNKLDCYILVTQCPADNKQWANSVSNIGKGDAPLTILQEILDIVLLDYPIDQNRIGIVGLCSGGSGAWSLLREKPNFFSGVVVFSTSPPNALRWDEHCHGTALWAFNNHGDESSSVESMRQFVERVNRSGGLAYLTEREGGHDSHTKALRDDKVLAWVVEQDRTKTTPPPGLVIYAYNDIWKPFFLFALPILLSILLGLLQIIRRRRFASHTIEKIGEH